MEDISALVLGDPPLVRSTFRGLKGVLSTGHNGAGPAATLWVRPSLRSRVRRGLRMLRGGQQRGGSGPVRVDRGRAGLLPAPAHRLTSGPKAVPGAVTVPQTDEQWSGPGIVCRWTEASGPWDGGCAGGRDTVMGRLCHVCVFNIQSLAGPGAGCQSDRC